MFSQFMWLILYEMVNYTKKNIEKFFSDVWHRVYVVTVNDRKENRLIERISFSLNSGWVIRTDLI